MIKIKRKENQKLKKKKIIQMKIKQVIFFINIYSRKSFIGK
jgi:hypothetical protein